MATEIRTTDAGLEPEQEPEQVHELEDQEEQQDQDDQSATTTAEETVPEQEEDEEPEPGPSNGTQPTADITTDDEELSAEEPTFLSMWKELTEVHLEDLVRLYKEGKRPYMKVYSKQKGNVHIRLDIHRRDRCTDFFSELAAGREAE